MDCGWLKGWSKQNCRVCGPKSAQIKMLNSAVKGSILSMDAKKPNPLVQSIPQDQVKPSKTISLSHIASFVSDQKDCPIVKYELVNPSKGVIASKCVDKCVSPTLTFNAADKTL
jgi:hypothetical protein